MSLRPLGELAVEARVCDARQLEGALARQARARGLGDLRRLGETLVDVVRCPRAAIREVLRRQGVTIVGCTMCGTRYQTLGAFQGRVACPRCSRPVAPTAAEDPLSVEDSLVEPGPAAAQTLALLRQRNPRLGRHEVLGEVGRGGMGVVYKAWDPQLNRFVALKLLHQPESAAYEDKVRFKREAQAVARLRHEAIVAAHGLEDAGGVTYLVMDFVPGVSLETLVLKGIVQGPQLVQVAARIARGLHHAHEQGIVHRDVKPGNIVLDQAGRPFLVDFGIAKSQSESMSLTAEGEVVGSLAYMAPEYMTEGASAVDAACDVFGLGVVLYQALSGGRFPYGDPADEAMVQNVVQGKSTPLAQVSPGIPPALCAVVDRAVAADRARRHRTALELAIDLERSLG